MTYSPDTDNLRCDTMTVEPQGSSDALHIVLPPSYGKLPVLIEDHDGTVLLTYSRTDGLRDRGSPIGGGSLPPGVTSDGLTPGGLAIAGGLTVAGSAPGKQLAYAEATANQTIANADDTAITNLTITPTIATGVSFVLELYISRVDEDSGSTSGDQVSVDIEDELSNVISTAMITQTTGGTGSFCHIRTNTQTGDGLPHTYSAHVSNLTNTNNGAIIYAGSNNPAYIRAVGV